MSLALSYPVRLSPIGRIESVEPGTRQAALEHVALVTSTEQGALPQIAPELGLPAYELQSSLPTNDVIAATIEDQVPNTTITVERGPSPDAGYTTLQVSVEVNDD